MTKVRPLGSISLGNALYCLQFTRGMELASFSWKGKITMMNDLNPEALEHVAQGVGGRKDVANNIVTWLRLAKAYRQDVKIKATDPRTGKMAVFQVKDGEITSKPPTIELEPDMASETPMALRAIR